MAGRHGNKGVVSRVMPIENMPYLEDGTPVDIVLNPLGVPSRMNVGQVLETHLGWAARGLGIKLNDMIQEGLRAEEVRQFLMDIYKNSSDMLTMLKDATYDELKVLAQKYKEGVTLATPVFDGASEAEIKEHLRLAGLDDDGQTVLFDGRTEAILTIKSQLASCMFLSFTTWSMKNSTHVQQVRILLLRNNLWVVKLNQVVSVLVRWKCGRLRLRCSILTSRDADC